MKFVVCGVLMAVCALVLAEDQPNEANLKKRGLFDLGYHGGHELLLSGHEGLELEHGIAEHAIHTKFITKEVQVPVPHPYPVTVVKKVPYPVKVPVPVPVDRPYPVPVPKPYPVPVEKRVPYPVEKPVPYLVNVPVQVPVPVPHPVPVPKPVPVPIHVPKPYHVPVPQPFYIHKQVPVLVQSHHESLPSYAPRIGEYHTSTGGHGAESYSFVKFGGASHEEYAHGY